MSPSVCVWEQLITRALCVYGRIWRAGQLATAPLPPLFTHARCTSILAGSRFGVELVSRPQPPPSTSPLSTRHNCVISSKEREFSVPLLLRSAFSRSCIKFAFPRARGPKIPGTRDRENTKPGSRERETGSAHEQLIDTSRKRRSPVTSVPAWTVKLCRLTCRDNRGCNSVKRFYHTGHILITLQPDT